MRVLIVEDHAINRRLLRAQLEAERIDVVEAEDGAAALRILPGEPVDAVVSDILMPRMDGYRLCYELRAHPGWKDLPFIFYTATYTTPEDEKAALELGADAFLRKPASPDELVGTLRDVMARPRRAPEPVASPDGVDLMKVYNERLVAKLEERNLELEATRDELRRTNASLEERVKRRTAQLEEANRQLESFASFVSHELRTPLRAIDGFTAMLAEDHGTALPAEGQRLLGVIERNTKRMGQLVEDLLRFAQLGRAAVKKEPIDISALVQEVVAERRGEWEPRGVVLEFAELPPAVGDPALLRIVFHNLVSNALKFTRHRAPARVEIGSREAGRERIYYVRDNGAGFDMQHAARLFAPFERLHTKEQFEGTGVGLGMVRNIIERHGGRVWAEGALGEGATFSFTLEAAP